MLATRLSGSFRSPKTIALRGTRRSACRLNVAIPDLPGFGFCVLLCILNALDAERAFFHDSARPNRHFRVIDQALRFLFHRGVVEKVEAPDFEGAVIGTVPRTDAPVIRHLIQTIRAVGRGIDRADDSRTARCRNAGTAWADRLRRGAGLLSIAAAKLGAGSVMATDIDPKALQATLLNGRRNGMEDRIQARAGSWYDALENGVCGPFDAILATPPQTPGPRPFGPRYGGSDGTKHLFTVVDGASAFLKPGAGFGSLRSPLPIHPPS